MDKKDAVIADLMIYAMKQIQMAKADRDLIGDYVYWTDEIQSMTYLLLHMDKLLGEKKRNDTGLPNPLKFFEKVDRKRKVDFRFFGRKKFRWRM